jgi:hypothetical protein
MNIKKHFYMTFAALFFLGLIIAKPGEAFYPAKEIVTCNVVKSGMGCADKNLEHQINYSVIHYQFNQE